jgi:hypothetical protein
MPVRDGADLGWLVVTVSEPPAGSEHYREGWRDGYTQAGIDRERVADSAPRADWSGSWAELTGYVRQAAEDGTPIDAAAMAAYLDELKHRAMAPVREWMDALTAPTEETETDGS